MLDSGRVGDQQVSSKRKWDVFRELEEMYFEWDIYFALFQCAETCSKNIDFLGIIRTKVYISISRHSNNENIRN